MSERHMSCTDSVNLRSSVNSIAQNDISYISELWDDCTFTLPIRPGCDESPWFLLDSTVPCVAIWTEPELLFDFGFETAQK